jgi:hypothetical protein
MSGEPVALARRLVDSVRAGHLDAPAAAELAALDPMALAAPLADDTTRIAFWVNVYNATVRAQLIADPAALRRRWRFFARPAIVVAGRRLSPNAIEHGILRRSAFLLGLGHVRNPWPSPDERHWRVDRVDPRVHFALNCGARSCPPLATWEPATLDEDLERAARAYLTNECQRTEGGRVLVVPRLLLWYRGDFGGSAGILASLRHHGIVGPDERPSLRYGTYDWTPEPDPPVDLPDSSQGDRDRPATADPSVTF